MYSCVRHLLATPVVFWITKLRMGRIQELIPPLIAENKKLRTFEHEIFLQVSYAVVHAKEITTGGGDSICKMICLERGKTLFFLLRNKDLQEKPEDALVENRGDYNIRMICIADPRAMTGLMTDLGSAVGMDDYTHIRDRLCTYICTAFVVRSTVRNQWERIEVGDRIALHACPEKWMNDTDLLGVHCSSYGLLSVLIRDAWKRIQNRHHAYRINLLTNCMMLRVVWC